MVPFTRERMEQSDGDERREWESERGETTDEKGQSEEELELTEVLHS